MVVVAEAYLQYHESNAIDCALHRSVSPKSYVRYVDDGHSRFENVEKATVFRDILNEQDPDHLKYTIEIEDNTKKLNYLDLNIHNNNGHYEFKIHRKNAITNVQIKPNSGHDPKILKAIFTGFLDRAFTICTDNHLENEINFLVTCFVENGYSEYELKNIVQSYRQRRNNYQTTRNDDETTKIVSLPWVPGLSPKLRKSFRKVGYKAVFKSSANLKTILTSKNKCKLPDLSYPGVYLVPCKCGKQYVGETKLKTYNRLEQHKDYITKKTWDSSGISSHAKDCKIGFDWENASILKIENKRFDRKVREALEIQFQNTSPRSENGLNQDDGQYVTTNFWKPMFVHLREKSLN